MSGGESVIFENWGELLFEVEVPRRVEAIKEAKFKIERTNGFFWLLDDLLEGLRDCFTDKEVAMIFGIFYFPFVEEFKTGVGFA